MRGDLTLHPNAVKAMTTAMQSDRILFWKGMHRSLTRHCEVCEKKTLEPPFPLEPAVQSRRVFHTASARAHIVGIQCCVTKSQLRDSEDFRRRVWRHIRLDRFSRRERPVQRHAVPGRRGGRLLLPDSDQDRLAVCQARSRPGREATDVPLRHSKEGGTGIRRHGRQRQALWGHRLTSGARRVVASTLVQAASTCRLCRSDSPQ